LGGYRCDFPLLVNAGRADPALLDDLHAISQSNILAAFYVRSHHSLVCTGLRIQPYLQIRVGHHFFLTLSVFTLKKANAPVPAKLARLSAPRLSAPL
jgi:hypothetical protein